MNDVLQQHHHHHQHAQAAVARAVSRALFLVPHLERAVVVTEADGSVHVRGDSRKLEASIGVDLQPQHIGALCQRLQQLGVRVFASESEYAQALAQI